MSSPLLKQTRWYSKSQTQSKNVFKHLQQEKEEKEALEEMGFENIKQSGYTKFADLVAAKRKKEEELNERRTSRASGIGSLMGQNNILG